MAALSQYIKTRFLPFLVIFLALVLPTVTFLIMYGQKSDDTSLPSGFVHLSSVDATIIQRIMYYSNENFVGERVNGYLSPTAILTRPAANALKIVQAHVSRDNFSLVVYDAYRPVKAVQHFIRWKDDPTDVKMKDGYYPYIEKEDMFSLGYVATRSGHSRGSTVDVSLIQCDPMCKGEGEVVPILWRKLEDGRSIPYREDGTLDMFTSVDLMDTSSHHDAVDVIPREYLDRRNYLRERMVEAGFAPYGKEWWHYTLIGEPFPDQYFDFDVQ